MLLSIGVFLIVTGIAVGFGWALSAIPTNRAKKALEKRLRKVGSLASITQEGEAASVVRQDEQGPLGAKAVEKLIGKTGAGISLTRLIEQRQVPVGALVHAVVGVEECAQRRAVGKRVAHRVGVANVFGEARGGGGIVAARPRGGETVEKGGERSASHGAARTKGPMSGL